MDLAGLCWYVASWTAHASICLHVLAGSGITGNLRWDLGGQHFTLSLVKALQLAKGRFAELGASLSEKTQHVTLEGLLKPHKDHRLNAT